MADDDLEALRQRAVSSVLLVGLRGLLLRLIAFGGNVVLARLIAPEAFGQVAFALALASVGSFLADVGLGASLIRQADEPDPRDVAACVGAQVTMTFALVATSLLLLPLGGRVAGLTAVLALSLPVVSLRAAAVIALERRLEYAPVVTAETLDVLFGYVVAVVLVLSGAGVFGIALGTVAGSVVGTTALLRLARGTWVRPTLDLPRVRALLSFGAAYQSVAVVNLVRDEGVNLGIFLISGSAVLGIWTLAYRVLQVPFLLFEGLWRVSFPAMSRLIAAGTDVRPLLERGVAVASAWTGLVLCVLVGSAPAFVPAVFGERWASITDVLPAAGLSLMIGGPISAAGAGYLYAVGDAARVVRATLLHTACWLGVGLPLLPVVGISAISFGWLAGGILETTLFARGLRRHAGARLLRPVLGAAVPAVLAAAAGWLLATSGDATITRSLLSGLVATAVYVLALGLLDGSLLFEAVGALRPARLARRN